AGAVGRGRPRRGPAAGHCPGVRGRSGWPASRARRMTSILSVRDLEKTFGSLIAAHHITLDFPPEQTVGIIGANGAGKTTFINMVTGHLHPSNGSIHFEGHDITGLPSRQITRLGISRPFQVAHIFPPLTV